MRAKINKSFAENFKRIRVDLFLSRADMAELLEVSNQQIYKYEIGETKIPMNHIHLICTKFNLEYEIFFEYNYNQLTEEELSNKILSIPDYVARKKILKSINILSSYN
jgi:transcriptional regulator with XRE-family HTH domain